MQQLLTSENSRYLNHDMKMPFSFCYFNNSHTHVFTVGSFKTFNTDMIFVKSCQNIKWKKKKQADLLISKNYWELQNKYQIPWIIVQPMW